MQTVRKLYGLVRVLENAHEVYLLFASKKHARNFVKFVDLYILESGAGRGYGTYWHYAFDPVVGVDAKVGRGSLKTNQVALMASLICNARLLRPYDGSVPEYPSEYMPEIGMKDGAITFGFDERKLPPRIQPQVGDLVRIVCGVEGHGRGIMRVKEIISETAVLEPCKFSTLQARELPLQCVMKIHDCFNKSE